MVSARRNGDTRIAESPYAGAMPRRSFHKSRAAARALSFAVHNAADDLLARRSPGLRSQLLRAVASVPANIAEAEQQTSDLQALHFLRIALGSADEVGAHLETAADAGALAPRVFTACQGTRMVVRTMLRRLIDCLETDTNSQPKARGRPAKRRRPA